MSSIQCEVRSCKLLAVIEWLQINDPIFPSLFSNHTPPKYTIHESYSHITSEETVEL
jgi:hypothetical protein